MSFLGIDVGTSSVKVGLLGDDGSLVVQSADVAGFQDALMRGEMDAWAWWAATLEALSRLHATVDLTTVEAMSVIGNTPTLVCLDSQGKPRVPALLWSDTRAQAEAQELLREHSQAEWNAAYGTFMPVSAAYPSAKLRWLQKHWPAALGPGAHVVQPKDFINYQLTGVIAGDTWTSKGLVSLEASERERPLELLGLDPKLAPECYRPVDVIGRVTDDAARLTGIPGGVPVTAGWSDTLGAVWSLGLNVNDAFVLSGTSDSIGVIAQRAAVDRTTVLCAPIWDTGSYIVYGPTSSGVSTLHWAQSVFPMSFESGGEPLPVRPNRPWFLPYLLGQRSPIWADEVRGAWVNVDHQTTPLELADAVLEGIVAAERLVLDAVVDATGALPQRVVISGGGAKIERLNAWRRRVFPYHLFQADSDPVVGAARLAQWHRQVPSRLQSEWSGSQRWKPLGGHDEGVEEGRYQGFKRASTVVVEGLGQS
ncbi:MAG: hypothetical protein C7B45_15055 [Sulfobacillus acidophilus]|uniref:Carbohydrate kinase n=1 Tax=Sulfobacillus acidophilus TaxID=53633 RepID=A0A2T2WDU5_9FIRM|nr:MAG: hypothetical protein C7B45_15055 [Sulfobacillus acidophilus]